MTGVQTCALPIFTGPTWIASIPIALKAFHSDWELSVLRNEVPGAVMSESGYAVNHTDAFDTAARGSGFPYGFCHMAPWPDKALASSVASWSID